MAREKIRKSAFIKSDTRLVSMGTSECPFEGANVTSKIVSGTHHVANISHARKTSLRSLYVMRERRKSGMKI